MEMLREQILKQDQQDYTLDHLEAVVSLLPTHLGGALARTLEPMKGKRIDLEQQKENFEAIRTWWNDNKTLSRQRSNENAKKLANGKKGANEHEGMMAEHIWLFRNKTKWKPAENTQQGIIIRRHNI